MTADFFTDGDVKKAKILLEGKTNEIPRDSLKILSLLSGGILVFFWIIFLCLITTKSDDRSTWEKLQHQNPIMRVTFYLIYVVFAAGLCVHVFRVNEINYMHILELDYRKKVSQYQLWTSAGILMLLWTTAFTYDFLKVFFFNLGDRNDWSCLVLLVVMLFICIQPCFNFLQRITRWEILKSLA